MNIGLMTWFHYTNYGTALQVFASSKYLEEKGNKVKVIQYYPNPQPMYFPSRTAEYIYRGKRKLHRIFTSPEIIEKTCKKSFYSFLKENVSFTTKAESKAELDALNDEFDCFICGSDQIWSPLNFDIPYFLDFVKDPDRMIAYAPSMGVSHIARPGDDQKISALTNRFKYLSVREKTGAEMLGQLNGREAKVVLDPTLLLEEADWNRYIPSTDEGKPYLLAYFLRENKKYWKVVKSLAQKLNLELKVIPVFADDLKMTGAQVGVGPAEFVNLIRGASFVCTDSFHGMAFSVNFNKQFLPFQRFASNAQDSQNSRVFDFLDAVGLLDRLYNGGKVAESKIDYGPVNERLETLRAESRAYLDGALEEIRKRINQD